MKLLNKVQEHLSEDGVIDAIESVATKSCYTLSGLTIFSGLTLNDWGVIAGIFLGFATFTFNVWFKMKYGRKHD
jgi:hypothetical protein